MNCRAESGSAQFIRSVDPAAIFSFLATLFAGSLAFTVVFYERRSLPHRIFVLGMVVLAAEAAFAGKSLDEPFRDQVRYWQYLRSLATAFLPGIWLIFSLTYARANAREVLLRWAIPLSLLFLSGVGVVLLFPKQLVVPVDGPAEFIPMSVALGPAGLLWTLAVLVSSILVMMNLERTYRASVGTMRWRIKFMVLGLFVLFAVRAYTCSQILLFQLITPALQALNSIALLVACALILRSLLRTGLFEVKVYPSQSVIQNSITVLLAGIYLVLVGALAKLVKLLGGDSAFHIKAFLVLVSLVLLTMLLLSDRVRLYTGRFVSRHFQRPIYDYRTVWRTFTEGTARQVQRGDLCEAVVKLVSGIFQALSVTIWTVDDDQKRLIFAASTSLSETKAGELKSEHADESRVIAALVDHPDPVDLDECKEDWAVPLRLLHPGEFRKGGNRFCVPLIAAEEMLGLMVIGDRVGGVPFSVQDLDLLRSVGEQAAASLLNIQLSQRLSQAKQLEAFQAMSAFFVHDLKNTASTLSLMLQNLPVHYQDPKFREDALRGISKTVTHINTMINRLSLLRQELTIEAVECDLNQVVTEGLNTQQDLAGVELVKELKPLPRIRLDPAQIQKVLTNLVLNARDAVGAGGQIRVETERHNGWVVLAVSDNGCGMSPEFIQRQLYRPFQTTKKKGIGIGMFHCKMIVDAHRGRMEVESKPGKGTEFRVLLPVTAGS